MKYIPDTDTLIVNEEDIKTLDIITDFFEYGFSTEDLCSLWGAMIRKKEKFGIINIKYED